MGEETGELIFFGAIWLLTICAWICHIVEEVTKYNPHDKPFPWRSCYWLCLVISIPIALTFVHILPFLLIPIVSSVALGCYQGHKEDCEQRRIMKGRFEELTKKHPTLNEDPPLRPSRCHGDQFQVFDINQTDPGYHGLVPRTDIEYLVRLYRRSDTYSKYERNDFTIFPGSLKDDTLPEFVEVLSDFDEQEDLLLSPQILKSKVSPGLYQLISKRLVERGIMHLRWTECPDSFPNDRT